MDKEDSNSSGTHLCDKIKNAAASACPFRAIRRVTHRPSPVKKPKPKSIPNVTNTKIIEINSRPDPPKPAPEIGHRKGDPVAINFDFEKPNPHVGGKANHEVESHKKTGVHIEDSFSDYINRARKVFRTSTFAAGDHGKGPKDQNDDEVNSKVTAGKDGKFNEFIDRAKKKFRSSSSIGGGRSVSFK